MPKPAYPELIYLGRSRLHRNRANLIQTLHTVAAFTELGIATRLYLPPWHSKVTSRQRLHDMGIDTPIDLHAAQLLHRRWPRGTFVSFHQRLLRRARAVYVRAPELSAALASRGIRHHFEIHTLQGLPRDYGLEVLVEQHRQGVIDWLVPISRSAADTLIGAGADPGRIHVAPSGVALETFQAVADLQPERLKKPRMVYLGRISLDRGLDILSQLAAAGLGEMTLVGDTDDPVPRIPGLTHRPAVPHREVAGLYTDSDLVILPYQPDLGHADGISPMKLFEAMAAGRPVIASDIPPLREILTHGRNALLADPKDPAAWQAAVEQLRNNPDLAMGLAHQARQDARAYDWPHRAAGIAQAIGLLAPDRASSS
ncbi:MAG: glycosyltransferase family 4 protein [Candidatus Thiodiazotropha sp.]|jgi:glycosyltransferase involved in cell wall biosynthesis